MTFASKLIKGGLMMRKQIKNIITILGGIIVMTNLSGCSEANAANNPATSSSINQREARAVEAQFEPLFQFLAEEKKDFSKLKRFYSSYTIYSKDRDVDSEDFGVHEEHTVQFNNLDFSNEGSYIVKKDGVEITYPIFFDSISGQITGQDIIIPPFTPHTLNSEILKSYPVTSYLAEHTKTELTTIDYRIDKDFPLLQEIVTHIGLQDVMGESISLTKNPHRYDYTLWFSDKDFDYSFSFLIREK